MIKIFLTVSTVYKFMSEVNEQLIQHFLMAVKGIFCISDISFKVPRNYSNIDILAYDPKRKKYYDIEVKYRSQFSFPDKDKAGKPKKSVELEKVIKQLSQKERTERIKEIIGIKKVIKVLIVTKHSFGINKRTSLENKFFSALRKKGFNSEIWYFDDIVKELYKEIELRGRHNNEFSQIIRMIKTYI
jgi:hypothetical protein